MTLWTVSLHRVVLSGEPTPDVLRWRHGLQVIRVHTVTDATEEVEVSTLGHRADQDGVGEAMGTHGLTADAEAPIAGRQCPTPEPTPFGDLDAGQETVERGQQTVPV